MGGLVEVTLEIDAELKMQAEKICAIIVPIPMIRYIWLSRPGNGNKMSGAEKAGQKPRFFLDTTEINDIIDINYIK